VKVEKRDECREIVDKLAKTFHDLIGI